MKANHRKMLLAGLALLTLALLALQEASLPSSSSSIGSVILLTKTEDPSKEAPSPSPSRAVAAAAAAAVSTCPEAEGGEPKGVFFGIFSTSANREIRDVFRRHMPCIRGSEGALNTIRFILGSSGGPSSVQVEDEERALGDIDTLPSICPENMNNGKTYHYFAHAYHAYPCHAFYVKVDQDTAFLAGEMQRFLTLLQQQHTHGTKQPVHNNNKNPPLYVGRAGPMLHPLDWRILVCWWQNNFGDMAWYWRLDTYMAGMLYALNHEAVRELLALRPTALAGDEDQRMGHWMQTINATRVNVHARFHDYPDYYYYHPSYSYFFWKKNDHWAAPITRASLAVHQCKTPERLETALQQLCQSRFQ